MDKVNGLASAEPNIALEMITWGDKEMYWTRNSLLNWDIQVQCSENGIRYLKAIANPDFD